MSAFGHVGSIFYNTPGTRHGNTEDNGHHQHDDRIVHFIIAFQFSVGAERPDKNTNVIFGTAFNTLRAQPAVVVALHGANVLSPGTGPSPGAAGIARLFFVFFACVVINCPELGHRSHGVGAQKSAHRAKILAKNPAPVNQRKQQTHDQDYQKQQRRGDRAGDQNNAERNQRQK